MEKSEASSPDTGSENSTSNTIGPAAEGSTWSAPCSTVTPAGAAEAGTTVSAPIRASTTTNAAARIPRHRIAGCFVNAFAALAGIGGTPITKRHMLRGGTLTPEGKHRHRSG